MEDVILFGGTFLLKKVTYRKVNRMIRGWKLLRSLLALLIILSSTISGATADATHDAYELRLDAQDRIQAKDWAAAEQLLRRATSLDSRNSHGYVKLGWVCSKQGKHREAVLAFQRASEIDPNDSDVKVRLVQALIELNDDRAALHVLDALQRMPLNAEDKEYTLSNLGFIQLRNKRPVEAARAYRELTLLKPEDPDYLYDLIRAYKDAGQYSAASNLTTVYLTRFPNGKNAPYLKSLSTKLKQEKEPTRWYARWAESAMPLKVCLLDPARPIKGYQPNFRALVGRAIETWQRQTRNLVSFRFVPTPAQANIIVEWTDDVDSVALKVDPKDKEEHHIGYCRPEALDARGNFTRTKVTLLTIDPYEKTPYKDLTIESIALHEFGHALGLPHSSTPGDVMFPWEQNKGDGRTRLSVSDVARVVQLYTYKRAGAARTVTPGKPVSSAKVAPTNK